MQIHERKGYVLKRKGSIVYLDKSMKNHTASLFSAITFRNHEEAEHMLTKSHFKPANPESYLIVETIERRMEKEDDEGV